MSAPLEVSILPGKRGLGAEDTHSKDKSIKKKKRRRGGDRSRKQKHAAAARSAKQAVLDDQNRLEMETESEGLFAVINHTLSRGSQRASELRSVESGGARDTGAGQSGVVWDTGLGTAAAAASKATAGADRGSEGRRGLLSQHDTVKEAQTKVQRLQEMLQRNRSNKAVAPQISAKLKEAQAELTAAKAEHTRMHQAVAQKEAQKKWMKF